MVTDNAALSEAVILNLTVLGAATLQSLTGVGFGVIAGPIMLTIVNSTAALQMSMMLSFLIAAALLPSCFKKAERGLLLPLGLGTLVGTPIGLVLLWRLDINVIKLCAGLAILFTLLGIVAVTRTRPLSAAAQVRTFRQGLLGIASGVMNGSLAMPGPFLAVWMAAKRYEPDVIRATILTLFIFSYSLAFLLQLIGAEILRPTLWQAASLIPATLTGAVVGHLLVGHLSERVLKWVLVAVLLATAFRLFSDSVPTIAAAFAGIET